MVLVAMFSTLLLDGNDDATTSVVLRYSWVLPGFLTNQNFAPPAPLDT